MAALNSTIMEKVWLAANNDFQQRIPPVTQGNIDATVKALFDPMNRQYFNIFMDILINRIAFTYVRGKRWENKLAIFKGQKINYGSTIQEIAPNWIKAHSYSVDAETLLKLNKPEAEVWYHSQNRQDKYPISISYDALRTAFVDEYGLNNFIASVMEVPYNSDEYDEYRIMMQLVAEYEQHFGFYKENISAITNEATAKAFLEKLKELAGLLEFPSARYNAADVNVPVFARNSELVILMTPGTKAKIDIEALMGAFQLDKGEIKQRIITVDEFPIPNVEALLTTEDFFVCHDTLYENTNFWNPETLVNNYWLHHWGVYSVSPFVPAILFTTETGTTIPTVTQTVTGIDLTPATATVEAGKTQAFEIRLTGSLSPATYENLIVSPNAATFEVIGEGISARNYVDKFGVLHTDKNLESGNELTVKATATYINPSGTTTEYTDTATVTIA